MGVTFQFSEVIIDQFKKVDAYFSVEVDDNHGTPEIRIGPKDEAYKGYIASFSDWDQFVRFVDSVNELYSRLEEFPRKKIKP